MEPLTDGRTDGAAAHTLACCPTSEIVEKQQIASGSGKGKNILVM